MINVEREWAINQLATSLLEEERRIQREWILSLGINPADYIMRSYRADTYTLYFVVPKEMAGVTIPLSEAGSKYPALKIERDTSEFQFQFRSGAV